MLNKISEYKWLIAGFLALVVFAVILFSPKISLEQRLLKSGKAYQASGEPREAIEDYERAVHYAPESAAGLEAARRGGGICLYELKNYLKAIFFFRHIVRHGQKVVEVRWAQQRLAEIYYEKLNNYAQAVVEYERLRESELTPEEAAEYSLKLGRSYFYLANFDQAISEAKEFITKYPQSPAKFQMMLLEADSFLAMKDRVAAIEVYESIEKEFPNHEDLYQVRLNKALAFEDQKEWDSAVEELEQLKDKYPHPDIIDLKIKSILRRKARKKSE
jgi:tetratricopeptide (TPR) repeat protein